MLSPEAVLEILTKRREFRLPDRHHLVHEGETFSHIVYSGLVFLESHYWYRLPAGMICVCLVLKLFLREEGE